MIIIYLLAIKKGEITIQTTINTEITFFFVVNLSQMSFFLTYDHKLMKGCEHILNDLVMILDHLISRSSFIRSTICNYLILILNLCYPNYLYYKINLLPIYMSVCMSVLKYLEKYRQYSFTTNPNIL